MTGLLVYLFVCCFNWVSFFVFINIKYKSFLAGVELNFGIANRITGFRIFFFWSFLKVFKNYENCILVCVSVYFVFFLCELKSMLSIRLQLLLILVLLSLDGRNENAPNASTLKIAFACFYFLFYLVWKKETDSVRVLLTCFNTIYVYLSVACLSNCFPGPTNPFMANLGCLW